MRTRNANTRVGMQHKYINLSRDKLSRDVLSRDNRSIVKKIVTCLLIQRITTTLSLNEVCPVRRYSAVRIFFSAARIFSKMFEMG